jgi:hypothetical protein
MSLLGKHEEALKKRMPKFNSVGRSRVKGWKIVIEKEREDLISIY